jgi:hypothetical protein
MRKRTAALAIALIAMLAPAAAFAATDGVSYTYDQLGRVKTATYQNGTTTITYSYDSAGNRTSVVTGCSGTC